ncbi:mandelate racemase/muconate lactonizing enzyme family protein [Ensifer soli]|uniref:mandelate racemase/muconate lactonizing enzyme family protein n=1 Tax=Ciceribacter sp. sgz301302 TaxID=3342379 RepID=UPI0035B932AF
MRIVSVETFVLRVPLGGKTFYSSQAKFPERNSLLVKITADNGLVGWGEGGQYGPPEPVSSCVNDVLAPILMDLESAAPVVTSERLYSYSRDFGQKGTYIEAISAIDIALWDLWGKSLGQPVHALMGGAFRSSVHAYATGCYYPDKPWDRAQIIADLETEAASYVSSGFDILKMKIGLLSVDLDIERVAAVRRAIGPGIRLLVDCNHAYNAVTAIRIGRELENFGVHWIEEPVVPEDKAGYRRVRDAITVPVAGGEAEFTRYGFRDLFLEQCVDIAQPDLCVCGGFSEWLKIQALASSFGVMTVPHVWGSGIALAAALQALATIPPMPHTANPVALQNEPIVEFDRKHNPLRDDLLIENFTLKDGFLDVPQGPGLGVTVDEDVMRKYLVPA